ncbi:MAG: DNA polymerase III subunit delta', partial [Bacteroidia bacterium]|nr:DNA polymerase III subunit delta' [Bacteroidia bacterium]
MNFEDVIGQSKAAQQIIQAVQTGRLSHALLVRGIPGVGKLAFAQAIAQYVNCTQQQPNGACGHCESCLKIQKGIHPDVHYVFPIFSQKLNGREQVSDDFISLFRTKFFNQPYFTLTEWVQCLDADNKQLGIHISEIRHLKRKLALKSFEGKYKVTIFWYAEKMNQEAANAFLKLLEEPPDNTLIIMTVADSTQLLPTITSRCQSINLSRIPHDIITNYLIREYEVDPVHANEISILADGSVAAAIEMLSHTNESMSDIFRSWIRTCYEGNLSMIQEISEKLASRPREFQKLFLSYTVQKIRDSLFLAEELSGWTITTEKEKEFLIKFSKFINRHGVEKIAEY